MKKYEEVTKRLQNTKKRYWAGDNISEYIFEGEKETLIEEAAEKFEGVLDALLIDRATDPNSEGTAKRLAKMYYNELMQGRYDPIPKATAFPNPSHLSHAPDGLLKEKILGSISSIVKPLTGQEKLEE